MIYKATKSQKESGRMTLPDTFAYLTSIELQMYCRWNKTPYRAIGAPDGENSGLIISVYMSINRKHLEAIS